MFFERADSLRSVRAFETELIFSALTVEICDFRCECPFLNPAPVTHCTASVSHYKVLIHRGLWPRLSGGWEMLSWQWDVNIVGQIFSRDKSPARSLQLKGRLLIHVENLWPRRDHKVQCPWASATLCSQDQNVFLPRIPLNFDFSKSPLNCFILKPMVLQKKTLRKALCVLPFLFYWVIEFPHW